MPPVHLFVLELSLLWEGLLCSCFDLAKVFLQGATIPPLHPFFLIIIIVGKGIMLLFRISQGISSGCHHATPKPFFLELSLLWEGALCFCFDLAKVLLQGATILLLQFFGIVIMGRGIMLLLRLSQGISSGCHHATPTPIFFDVSLLLDGGIMLPLGLSQGISSGCHHETPKPPKKFVEFSLLWEGALCFSFDLAKVLLQGVVAPVSHI